MNNQDNDELRLYIIKQGLPVEIIDKANKKELGQDTLKRERPADFNDSPNKKRNSNEYAEADLDRAVRRISRFNSPNNITNEEKPSSPGNVSNSSTSPSDDFD